MPDPGVPMKGALFFCHGYGSTCTFFFEGTAKRIAGSGYGVYAMDYPGFGLSEGLHGHVPSFDDLVDDVIEIFAKIKERPEVRELPRFILGQSMGGAVALKAHLKESNDWDGVILVAPMCKIAEGMLPSTAVLSALSFLSNVVPKAKLFPFKDISGLTYREPSKRKMAGYNVLSYDGNTRLKTGIELLKATQDIESQLHKVSAPLLILHGAEDKVTDPLVSQFLYEKASSKDKTLKIYEGGYHGILEGEPDDRIFELLQNKRDVHLKQMRKEIFQFLQAGQEPIARIRIPYHFPGICKLLLRFNYSLVKFFFCNLSKMGNKVIAFWIYLLHNICWDCPSELREAIASIIFAAPRCSDVPDLLHIKNLFTTKYGKEFVSAVSELRPDSGVNRMIIEKLSVSAPSGEVKLKVLREIAEEYNLAWDSSQTEAEFRKNHEDLLGGTKAVGVGGTLSHIPNKKSYNNLSTHEQEYKHQKAPSPSSNSVWLNTNKIEQPHKNNDVPVGDAKSETRLNSSDVLDKARVAIASAERATAAARAAAALVQNDLGSLKLEGKSL
ncbi:unnamed protein product [Lupinus luteus]|uniref:Serine aminopeptidase S33 domain-containing protein n=1 Tax=Lupinus luteus TaxID=3873 RepID=A0AAV1VTT5_LUPLU